MTDSIQVIFMTLQALSTVIIDVFFLMTVVVAFMTVFRFGQFSAIGKITAKKAAEVTVELIVQGIAMGAVFSFMLVFLGLPVMYNEYLYFLLPLAFILGLYHVRFTNLIYAATMMSVVGMFLSGGTVGTLEIPEIDFSVAGMAMLTGGLMVMMAIVMAMTGTKHLKPIVAKKDQHIVLGFAQQRIWAVPVVTLVALGTLLSGDSVGMPDWWPLLSIAESPLEETTLFMLPLLLLLSHGSISFAYSPQNHVRLQVLIQAASGAVLLAAGYIGSAVGRMDSVVLVIMLLTGAVPEIIWNMMEGDQRFLYLMDHHGVYIGTVTRGSRAASLGFEPGDRITEVNGQGVLDLKALEVIYRAQTEPRALKVERIDCDPISIDVDRSDIIHPGFGLGLMPQRVAKVFDYKDVIQMNMMHIFRYPITRDGSES